MTVPISAWLLDAETPHARVVLGASWQRAGHAQPLVTMIDHDNAVFVAVAAEREQCAWPVGPFKPGDSVRKKRGSSWSGRVVGWYSTSLTPAGFAVESDAHPGSVQIYPADALELMPNDGGT